jgi:hypothetical protein
MTIKRCRNSLKNWNDWISNPNHVLYKGHGWEKIKNVMKKEFESLTTEERDLLLRAPVLVSVLVSSSPNEINETKKTDAIKLAHLRTFTATPLLLPYYQEVDKIFKAEFEKAEKLYFPFDRESRTMIKLELNKVHHIIRKLDEGYAKELIKSLDTYSRHIRKSVYSVFQDVIFPLGYSELKGL